MRFSTCIIIIMVLVLSLSVPVEAQNTVPIKPQNTPYFISDSVTIEPESYHQFNFTWFDVEYAESLTFLFVTGNMSAPLYVYVENATYVYEYIHDWMRVIEWSGDAIPETEELWWFSLYNRHTLKSVNVSYSLTYDNRLAHSARLEDWLWLGLLIVVLFVVIGLYFYRDIDVKGEPLEYDYEPTEVPEHIKKAMEKEENE